MQKRRITANEILESKFYQLPKFLVHNEEFKKLSSDAKILYSIMRDRHQLSLQNNWIDNEGYVFLIYSRENMMEDLQLSDKTITKAVKDLKKHGLIDEVRQGQGKPNLIYVMTINLDYQQNRKKYVSKTVKNTNLNSENLRPNNTKNKQTDMNDTENKQQQHKEDVVVTITNMLPSTNKIISDEMIDTYKNCFDKKPTIAVQRQIARFLMKFERDAIEMALEMASNKGKEFDYAIGIIKKWQQAEAFTIEDIVKYDMAYEAKMI